jgi:hypothetical protein
MGAARYGLPHFTRARGIALPRWEVGPGLHLRCGTDVDSEEMELLGASERDFGRSSDEFPSTDEVWDPRGMRRRY